MKMGIERALQVLSPSLLKFKPHFSSPLSLYIEVTLFSVISSLFKSSGLLPFFDLDAKKANDELSL